MCDWDWDETPSENEKPKTISSDWDYNDSGRNDEPADTSTYTTGYGAEASTLDNLTIKFEPAELDAKWTKLLDKIQKSDCKGNLRICTFGAKGVGKSTQNQWIVNRLLKSGENRVLYIDLDPGCPEFSPPGLLSVTLCENEKPITGKNYEHLAEPKFCSYLGYVNVSSCPENYLKAQASLLEQISSESRLANIPWVINTMGNATSEGLDVDFACEVVKTWQPTSVIQIYVNDDKRAFQFDLDFSSIRSHQTSFSILKPEEYFKDLQKFDFYNTESAFYLEGIDIKGKKARECRMKLFENYFSKLGSIISVKPYKIPLDKIGVACMKNPLYTYDQVLRLINGNLVALCFFPEDALRLVNQRSDKENNLFSIRKRLLQTRASQFIPGPQTKFFGYGIVRSIEKVDGQGIINLVTPVDPDLLITSNSGEDTTAGDSAKVNCIISGGALDIPKELFIREPEKPPYILYNSPGKEFVKIDPNAPSTMPGFNSFSGFSSFNKW